MPDGLFDFLDGLPEMRSPLQRRSPVILYGAGHLGREIAEILQRRGIPVACFLDRKASVAQEVNGIPVFHPKDAAAQRARYPVIVTIFNRDVHIPDVIDELGRCGYSSVATVMDVYDDLSADLGNRFWLTPRTTYRQFKDQIRQAHGLLADDQSKDLFRRILEFRMSGNYRVLPTVNPNQYFPRDVPPWKSPLRFVDAGAYDGDTLRDIAERGLRIEALAAFEPDAESFAKLAAFMSSHQPCFGTEISLYPCGLWSKTERLAFTAESDEGSHIASSRCPPTGAQSFIQGVGLDDVLPRFAPTLIKMDIEGAEADALTGATHTIAAHLPGLAICAYHRPPDLWDMPLRVRKLSPRYSLYLRSHGCSGFDLVLYALPD